MKVHVRHGLATVTRRSVPLLLSRERRSPTCAVTEAARRVSAAWEERPAHASAKWLELREDLLGPRWRLYGQTKPVGGVVPARGIHHVDLAVADVKRSLAFYLDLLGPLGWAEEVRYPTYRGTEEVVYLVRQEARNGGIGLRPADGGTHRYYDVGIEHFAFEVDRRGEVDEAHARCLASGANVHFPPEEDRDEPGYYAFFAFDPDGIRVEVFCWSREETVA